MKKLNQWFKKHFIPDEGNDHRPHVLRGNNIRNIVILIIFLEIITFLIPTIARINMTGGMAAVLPAVLASLTNEERESQNLSALAISPLLTKAAELKASDMAEKGYFAHTSPEGITPWYWLSEVGYRYQYAGENLAVNFNDSKDVTNAWMNSPTHRANIVKGIYTEVGTGIATGFYKGERAIFVAQVYANPIIENIERFVSQNVSIKPASRVVSIPKEETARVLGVEVATDIENEKKVSEVQPVEVNTEEKVLGDMLGEAGSMQSEPTFWQRMLASPRSTTNIVLFIMFGIIVVALLLNIFIKIKHQHPDLITNGLIALAIIGAIFIANYYFSNRNLVITDSIDYSSEGK